MIISNKQVQTVLQYSYIYYPKRTPFMERTFVKKADVTILSNRVQDFKIAKDQVQNSPDIRKEKITEIKNLIQEGTYYISGAEIAQMMINRSLADEFAGR